MHSSIYFSIIRMGNQLCKCQGNDHSSTEVFLSNTLKTNTAQRGSNCEPTELEQEEFDNPSRGLLNHNFLKTSVTASNNLLRLSPRKEEEDKLSPMRTLDKPTTSLISLYKMDTDEVVTDLQDSSNEARERCESKAGDVSFLKVISQPRQRRLSIESKIPTFIQQQQKKGQIRTSTTPEILRSISEYILSEKNLFEPVKVEKENFVRFKYHSIHQNYTFIEKLGEGSYGIVYKVQSKQTGEVRAAKIFKKSKISESEKAKLMNEINILRKLDHPNIIKIYQAYMSDNLYCIITEYCEGGSMLNFIQDGKHYSEQVLKVVMRKLFNALSYMHRLNIVHRDIKLDNIVLVNKFESEADADKLEIRLIDFGLAKVLPNKRIKDKEKVGTYTHMAPEVLKGIYSTKCDIWSAGVLLFLMVSGSSPFKKATKELTYEGILNDDLRFEGEIWRRAHIQLKDLLLKLLSKQSNERLPASQALQHPFLRVRKEEFANQEIFERVAKKFCDYNRGNNLVSVIESYLAYTSTTSLKFHEYSQMFSVLDSNSDGYIERQELETAFQRSGLTLAEGEIEYVLGTVDKNNSGRIDYSEFVTILSDRKKLFTRQKLISAFKYLDSNGNGFLEKAELKQALKSVDNNELASILVELDMNHDDKISQEEFINYLEKERFV